METLFISATAVVTAILSTYGIMRGHNKDANVSKESNNTVQIQTIFDGYSKIVADLHVEVQRLHHIVDALHKEQEACEERNVVLELEIEDLQARICKIEEISNGK